MKKILLLTSESLNLKSGGGLANKAFFDSLVLRYPDSVDVVQIAHSLTDVDHDNFYFVPEISKAGQVLWLLRGRYHRLYQWMPSFLAKHGKEYSYCILNASTYADTIDMMSDYGIKTAVIHHNYEVRYQMDNRLPSTLFGFTPYMVERNERLALNKAELNMYLTEYDKETIISKYNISSNLDKHVVVGMYEPRVVTDSFDNSDDLALNDKVLAICGSLSGLQTEQSVFDVFENYYNIMAEQYSGDFKLIIAGRNPSEKLVAKCNMHENVVLKANPENMFKTIDKAGIFICPVNCGSGLKLRIMDGLKLGMPILTHEVSARGYEQYRKFKWFQVYNDKQSFAAGLRNIVSLIELNGNLRNEIKTEYNNYFSFENGNRRFIKCIESFCK